MASFAEGLASGLSGLPQALLYRQEQDRKDAYKKDIAGLSSTEGPFDYEAAARVALKHGDTDSSLSYRRMAADAGTRAAAGKRQAGLDEIAAEDRTRRHATEDEASLYKKRQRFASRFAPLLKAGDTDQMGRMIADHPGLIGGLMNFGSGRHAAGLEAIQTPDGETRYAFQIRNARTGTTGPETANATSGSGDNVNSYSQEQVMRGLQPFLPAAKADKPPTSVREYEFYKEQGGDLPYEGFLGAKRAQTSVTVNTGKRGKPPTGFEWKIGADGEDMLHPIKGGPAEGKYSEAQVRVVEAAERISFGTNILDEKVDGGSTLFETLGRPQEWIAAKFGSFGNYFLSPEYQKANQAMNDIAGAILRMETGAAAPEFERHEVASRYSPRPGDGQEVMAQKRESLNVRWRNAETLAGPSYKRDFGLKAPAAEEEEGVPQAPEPAVQPPAATATPQPAPAPGPTPAPVVAPGVAQAGVQYRGGPTTVAAPPSPEAAVPEATPAASTIDPASFAGMNLGGLESMIEHSGTMSKEAFQAMMARFDELEGQ